MSYCTNPSCNFPENDRDAETCEGCGSKLTLRGRYRAVQVLGQGGFGRTYRAIDEDRLGADCVIKQFMPQVQGAAALEKATELFNQEAVRLYELGAHSQIPTLLAYFIHQNNQYLVQEFVPGVDLLKELEAEGVFSEEKIWTILFDLLPILQFVHEHQVIHRDIKPENLIRRQTDRRLVLIDFGGAKQMKSVNSAITGMGTTIGSPGFIPMEILTEGQVFPSSDLYSLGVTCFNLLTQISPDKLFIKYGFSWVGKWRKALKTPVSDALAQVLGKFLQENLEDRYQSVAAALEEAQRLRNTTVKKVIQLPLPTSAPANKDNVNQIYQSAVTALEEPKRTGNTVVRKAIQLPLPTSVPANKDDIDQLLQESFTARSQPSQGITILTREEDYELKNENEYAGNDFSEDDDLSQLIKEAVNSGAMSRNLEVRSGSVFEPSKDRGEKDRDEDEIYSLLKGINSQSTIAIEADISIEEWSCTQVIEAHPNGVFYVGFREVGFGEDSQMLISGGVQTTLKSWNMSGKLVKTLIDKAICLHCGGLGNVKKQLKTSRGLMGANSLTCPECEGFGTSPEHGESFSSIAFNSSAHTIALCSSKSGIKLFSDAGKFLRSLDCQSTIMNVSAISPDGEILAAGCNDQNIRIWDLEKDKLLGTLGGHEGSILALKFGYDNQTLISSSSDKTIKIWNIKTGKLLRTLIGHSKAVSSLALSADGQKLASGSYDTTVKIWNWKTGGMVFDLRGHSFEVTTLATCRTANLLASGANDGSINLWDLEHGTLLSILVEHGDRVTSLVFSPDSNKFVSGSLDHTIRVWEKAC